MDSKNYRNSWYMTTKAGKLYRKISGQITTACDMIKDFKICGKSLTKYVKDKPGWRLIKKDCVINKGILISNYFPIYYSIWTYDPTEKI